jgi:hypothetical protein
MEYVVPEFVIEIPPGLEKLEAEMSGWADVISLLEEIIDDGIE